MSGKCISRPFMRSINTKVSMSAVILSVENPQSATPPNITSGSFKNLCLSDSQYPTGCGGGAAELGGGIETALPGAGFVGKSVPFPSWFKIFLLVDVLYSSSILFLCRLMWRGLGDKFGEVWASGVKIGAPNVARFAEFGSLRTNNFRALPSSSEVTYPASISSLKNLWTDRKLVPMDSASA